MQPKRTTLVKHVAKIPHRLGWTRSSYYLISGFVMIILLIMYVWWPLVVDYWASYNPYYPFWEQFDWLLLGIFSAMSLLIMAGANLRKDLPIILIGLFGGLVIESWGTQTELWTYYTFERPPLWIIPAWPIASLSIDRLYRMAAGWLKEIPDSVFRVVYWILLPLFFLSMVTFTTHTIDKSLTVMALILVAFLIIPPGNYRGTVLTFLAGSGLGYFLELWGTTRLTWTYYTLETPPLFAVVAHGMAAVSFWRVLHLYKVFMPRIKDVLTQPST
jgi:hypothetical protein